MPTYQYACTACSHELEAVQSFTDDALTTCPQCEGRLRKLFGSVGVVFKGPGFYRTDSRAASSNGAGKSTREGSDAAGDGGKGADAGKSADTTTTEKKDTKASQPEKAAATSDSSSS